MMKFRLALVGALALMVASSAFAQRVPLQPKLIAGLGEVPLLTADGVEKLKFTAEQKEKYAKIETEYKDKYKSAQDAYKTVITGVRDREKFKEAQDKLQTETKKAREDSLGKVEPILTKEQKEVFAQVKTQVPQTGGIRPLPIGGAGAGQLIPPALQQRLNLTDEQKKQLEDIQKEVDAKIRKVLTDEQNKQLDQFKKGTIIRPVPQPLNPRIQPANPAQPQVQPAPAIKRD
jgi:Spy/CpxP family protein refolding chaperone